MTFASSPRSHQDLHSSAGLTPYTNKVWSLVSALELIATIILGCKLIERIKKNGTSASLILMGTLLFLVTSASAYNYFQFIYSERFLTFLIALYAYHYAFTWTQGCDDILADSPCSSHCSSLSSKTPPCCWP